MRKWHIFLWKINSIYSREKNKIDKTFFWCFPNFDSSWSQYFRCHIIYHLCVWTIFFRIISEMKVNFFLQNSKIKKFQFSVCYSSFWWFGFWFYFLRVVLFCWINIYILSLCYVWSLLCCLVYINIDLIKERKWCIKIMWLTLLLCRSSSCIYDVFNSIACINKDRAQIKNVRSRFVQFHLKK